MFKNTEEQCEGFVIETESAKWLTKYEGELQDENFGVSSKKYTVEYVHITFSNCTYTIDQTYQYQRVISPEVGINTWESAFLGPINDSTLTLYLRFSFTLREFIQAE